MNNLAVKGGTPLFKTEEFKFNPWPPVSEATADHIRELYLSRQWSFNSPAEQSFETAFAKYHGAKFGIFMSNGTVTLESALLALGVGPGDEVVVPDLTWIATAMAVRYVGAKCIFADIDPETYALSPESFEKAVTKRTKAVIPVHLYGSMADLEKIIAIAKKHKIAVVEDCAHMQGGIWNGRGAGSWGDIGSFSFQQSKTLAAGESGICITNDEALAERLYRCKHIGYSRYDSQGHAATPPPDGLICHNFRGLAIQARILEDQLAGLPDIIRRYNAFAKRLKELTSDIPGFRLQKPGRLAGPQGFYAIGMTFDWKNCDVLKIGNAMAAEGAAGINATYGPVNRHLLFNMAKKDYAFVDGGCPVCEKICGSTLVMMHWFMYYMETAEKLSAILHKISDNRKELE